MFENNCCCLQQKVSGHERKCRSTNKVSNKVPQPFNYIGLASEFDRGKANGKRKSWALWRFLAELVYEGVVLTARYSRVTNIIQLCESVIKSHRKSHVIAYQP